MRTDHGGEFSSRTFEEFCADNGLQCHFSAPYSPQQNGVVECRNQTVVTMASSIMKAHNVPNWLWEEAVTTVVYLLNRSYTRSVDDKTLYEAWRDKAPAVHHLRVFECVVHVNTTRPDL
jgi:transposase InsO family protein